MIVPLNEILYFWSPFCTAVGLAVYAYRRIARSVKEGFEILLGNHLHHLQNSMTAIEASSAATALAMQEIKANDVKVAQDLTIYQLKDNNVQNAILDKLDGLSDRRSRPRVARTRAKRQ